jgi:hypothetical protein
MKRAQMIVSEVTSCEGIMRSALLLSLTIVLLIALLGLVSAPALANGHGWHFKHSRHRHHLQPEACSETASAVFSACQHAIGDDYWIAQANCYNSAKNPRRCLREAEAAYEDAKAECQDQLDARQELCDELGEGTYNPDIESLNFENPAAIGDSVDPNPYFPLVPGYKWTYKSRDKKDPEEVLETNTVEVLDPNDESVTIEGIPCAVVHDRVYEGDQSDPPDPAALTEDTYDYYAQQDDGTVWYMGEFSLARQECDEETGELCQGLWGDEGSWQAGFEGGKPGIIMYPDTELSDPSFPGTVYRQELYLGEAEDAAEVMSFNEAEVTVPLDGGATFGVGDNVLETRDFSPLEPGAGDYKYYAPNIGVILEKAYEDDEITGEENQLVSFTP